MMIYYEDAFSISLFKCHSSHQYWNTETLEYKMRKNRDVEYNDADRESRNF